MPTSNMSHGGIEGQMDDLMECAWQCIYTVVQIVSTIYGPLANRVGMEKINTKCGTATVP